MSDWENSPVQEKHKCFLTQLASILIENVFDGVRRDEPVIRWREPAHLSEIIPFNVQEEPKSQELILEMIKNVYKFSVKTGHPYFMNQLFSGLDPYGLAGQWLTDSLNASIYTYEVAPVVTLMEQSVISEMLKMFYRGNEDQDSEVSGDGMFCPGGSYANGTAINLARFWLRPETKNCGIAGLQLVIFTSEDAHYSILKWSNMCGIGEKNVVLVATDELGRMDVDDLEANVLKEKERGKTVFMVSATAGTTVLGAIDRLDEIADICEKHSMWLHVDAAWGGGLIFSRVHRTLLKSIHRADSITFNPHKLLAVPQQCSLLLTRHSGIFEAAHSRKASYLFQRDKFYLTNLDVGDKYMQCGRRADVIKFWIMWQAKGTSGFEKHVDHLMSLSRHMKEEIERRDGFELVTKPSFVNVCFWYVPPFLRDAKETHNYNERLHKVAPKMKEIMTKRGSLMISYQPLRQKPNFFRFVVQNSGVLGSDVIYVLEELERIGKNL
ncbi:cysteine sulfinic acid decarboxylase [Neodiprion lecontei]|uniref:Cysteine sulfinic acid decarboxylase n=1 Tax=Neodiprion lecontei TaxID=441921 RepID=A0A6J0BVB4_NEOLC|nr:cysteine sulfinic acid decarboxylase [Neodiprion lecontei]